MQQNLNYVEIYNKPDIKPEGVIIILHGLGASGNDFVQLVPELHLAHSFKFIFPNAPVRSVTLNGGFKMQAWYDIWELSTKATATDVAGINQSFLQIDDLIKQQINSGFKSENIIIAGFSQGGVMSYITALNTQYKLAGVLALSCYLPEIATNIASSPNKSTPIFACHGTADEVVSYQAGVLGYETLKNNGYNIKFASYPAGHHLYPTEINDMSQWFDACLPS